MSTANLADQIHSSSPRLAGEAALHGTCSLSPPAGRVRMREDCTMSESVMVTSSLVIEAADRTTARQVHASTIKHQRWC